MKSYRVACLNCKGSNVVRITEVRPNEFEIDFNEDHYKHPDSIYIISGRYRPDMNFGWECGACGNTSIVARQEVNSEEDIKKMMPKGGELQVKRLAQSLKTADDKKFLMVEL